MKLEEGVLCKIDSCFKRTKKNNSSTH